MTEKDKIDVVQRNIESLRKELNSRIQSDLKYGQGWWQDLPIAVFKGNINSYLPVAPVLALLLVLIWQQSEFSLFRLGRYLMQGEERINKLAGLALLDYESVLEREKAVVCKVEVVTPGLSLFRCHFGILSHQSTYEIVESQG